MNAVKSSFQSFVSRLRKNQNLRGFKFKDLPLPLIFFLISLFLVYPYFVVNLADINPFDESAYINGGRMLLDKGAWSEYGGNPLVDVFYAITYLPFRNSPYWLIYSCELGRFLLFTLLWVSTYRVAKELERYAPPLVTMGIVLVTPVALEMLRFPSDPLFAGLAALSFWQLLSFYHTGVEKHLAFSSLFMGLAALARNDGLFSFIVLAGLTFFLSIRSRRLWVRSALVSLPFLGLVGGYILFHGVSTGDFSLGTMHRTYENFEVGQLIVYNAPGNISSITEARLEARRVFGTQAENHSSVFAAILRNPHVYLQRVVAVVTHLPEILLQAYGIRFMVVVFLLAVRGGIELLIRKKYGLILLFALWPAHLLTGMVITLYREGHLLFHFYIVFILASIGITALLANLRNRKEVLIWSILLGLVILAGLVGNKLAIYYGAVVFLVAYWLILVFRDRLGEINAIPATALFILLFAGLVIRGNLPSPTLQRFGAREEGVIYLARHLAPDSIVASASPGPVWMAKMDYLGLGRMDIPRDEDSESFIAWMRKENVRAVYVDQILYNDNPAMWELLKPQIGKSLERVYSGYQGDVQVLLVKGSP